MPNSDDDILKKLLLSEKHIISITTKAMFMKAANPFDVCVTRQDDSYTVVNGKAIDAGIIEKDTEIEGIQECLSYQWLGHDGDTYRQQIDTHLSEGGIFALTGSGAQVDTAKEWALSIASDFGKAVMFMHNDTINTAQPDNPEVVTTKLPGFYKS